MEDTHRETFFCDNCVNEFTIEHEGEYEIEHCPCCSEKLNDED